MTNLFAPPAKASLPLSKGNDLFVSFRYRPGQVDEDGKPVLDSGGNQVFAEADWPDGSTVTLVIETSPAISVEADIDGSLATVREESTVVDAVKAGRPWRLVLTDDTGLDRVLINGTVVRKDA
jgi:hypothetical protein